MTRKLAAALAASALLSTAVLAQVAPGTPPPPEIPQFQVEVLVFAYRDMDPNEERFELRRPPPTQQTLRERPLFDDSIFEPIDPDPTLPPAADTPPAEPLAFRLLAPEELQLNTEWRKIQNVPTYTPLLHAGWVQQVLAENEAPAVNLATLGTANPMGTIKVYLSRFLHVQVDLSYQDTGRAATAGRPVFGDGLSEVAVAPRYELATDQQTRSGELRYFDHPAFGVLVKVTRVQTPQGGTGTRPAA